MPRSTCEPRSGIAKGLRRNFRDLGSGFWLRRGVPLTVWDLESGS